MLLLTFYAFGSSESLVSNFKTNLRYGALDLPDSSSSKNLSARRPSATNSTSRLAGGTLLHITVNITVQTLLTLNYWWHTFRSNFSSTLVLNNIHTSPSDQHTIVQLITCQLGNMHLLLHCYSLTLSKVPTVLSPTVDSMNSNHTDTMIQYQYVSQG